MLKVLGSEGNVQERPIASSQVHKVGQMRRLDGLDKSELPSTVERTGSLKPPSRVAIPAEASSRYLRCTGPPCSSRWANVVLWG